MKLAQDRVVQCLPPDSVLTVLKRDARVAVSPPLGF